MQDPDWPVKPPLERYVARLSYLRELLQRFSAAVLILVAIGLMVVGKINSTVLEETRAHITDAFVPILGAMSRPAASVGEAIDSVAEFVDLHEENERLRRENALLMRWKDVALRLEAENRSLKSLLEFKPDPGITYITARVVAAPGSSFVRSVIVMAGRRDGVRKGQAAMAGSGIIGRVIEVGEWSSRVLLITDVNTRIPVVLEESRERAILVGDNSPDPRLQYLPPDEPVAPGARVTTSGHGGVFPPGLPVGVVSSVTEREIKVKPLVDLDRVEHVQLLDFGFVGEMIAERPSVR